MANNSLKVGQSNVVQGLGTYTFNVVVPGLHQVSIKASDLPPSGLIVTINKNGSPISPSPSPAPSAAQSHIDVKAALNCVANDAITVVLSSGSASDSNINSVKAIINIYIGPSGG